MTSPTPPGRLSRRRFLRDSTLTAGAAVLAGPALLRAQSPGRKLNLAMIGVGNKGADNLKNVAGQNIVALCDVDETFLNQAAEKVPGAKKYRDFRKMLEQKDIEAVVVTIPDHCHAVAAMMAIKLGKHVYCEKPLTHSIYEVRRLAQAAREEKVATQMGNAGHSSEGTRQLVEWIQAGVIGSVREVHSWSDRPIWPQGMTSRPAETPPVPASIAWDLWLGPAPHRPYHPAYHPFKWRGWWDFGTGALGDMGCHILDTPFWALKLGSPSSIETESSPATSESPPQWSIIRYQFPARGELPPVNLTWHDGGKQPGRELTEIPADQKLVINGSLFVGDKGKILIPHGRPPRLVPESAMKDFQPPPKTIPRSIGHHAEWIEACKGGPPTGTNFDYAGPLTEMVLLGNLALRAGKRIEWNSAGMKAANAPEVARYVRREYREGWTL